jgi:rubrerythrin
MAEISRRQFLYLSAVSSFIFQFSAFVTQSEGKKTNIIYPHTIAILEAAFKIEMIAYKQYIGFASRALREKYPNIAYMFHSFSYSEKIHADNYNRILAILGHEAKSIQIDTNVRDTKSNLQKAAKNELKKIKYTYPDFIKGLESEAYEDAIINCKYSLKSHQQHKEKVNQIAKYTGKFFMSVSRKIEGMSLDFHICNVCGSTIDEAPHAPCVICNGSMSNYTKVERPT